LPFLASSQITVMPGLDHQSYLWLISENFLLKGLTPDRSHHTLKVFVPSFSIRNTYQNIFILVSLFRPQYMVRERERLLPVSILRAIPIKQSILCSQRRDNNANFEANEDVTRDAWCMTWNYEGFPMLFDLLSTPCVVSTQGLLKLIYAP
jgi:hypothetical protein